MDSSLTIVTIVYIIMLVIPGVFFKRFYFQGPFANQFQTGQFADRFLTSLFWGIIVQTVTFLMFIKSFDVEYKSVFDLLKTTHGKLILNEVPELEESNITYIFLYLLASVAVAIFLGFFLFQLVRLFKLDQRFNVLQFSNKWHYYFSGEILNTREFKQNISKKGKVSATLVDILVKYGENDNRLFSGNLMHYNLTSNGDLETLYLGAARRHKNSNGDSIPAKEIPGDCFIIPYQNVLDINVQYVLRKTEKGEISGKVKKWANNTIQTILFLLVPIIIIGPWYTEVSVFMKILGNLSLLISWLFLAVFFANYMSAKKELTGKEMFYALSICVVFGFLGLNFIGIIDVMGYLKV